MKPILPALAQTSDPVKAYAYRYLIVLTVTVATTLGTIDVTIVSVALPSMMGNLGATLDEAAWASTGYILASMIVLPISGWMGDLLGRRNYYALSILTFTLASLMCGLSSSLPQLVLWRVIQGMAGGGLMSTAQVTIMETFPPKEVGIGMGIWGVGLVIGPAVGPPLGGWLTETLSWPWVFYVNVPIGALALLLVLMYVPDSRFARRPGKVDFIGLLLLAIGVGCLQALLERGERLDWLASREIMAYAVIVPLALGLLVWHELRCEHPVLDMRLFANRQFTVTMLLMAPVGVVGFVYSFAFPVLMQSVHGYTAVEAGLAVLPNVGAGVLGFIIAGRLISRPGIDLRWLAALGTILTGIGFWQHSLLTSDSGTRDVLFGQIVLGLGQPIGMLTLTTLGTATLRQHQVSGGNGLINFSRYLGGSMGIAAFATLTTHFQSTSRAEMIRHVNVFSDAAMLHLSMFRDLVISHGTSLALAPHKALLLLDLEVRHQARVIAFNQTMAVFALFLIAVVLIVPLLPKGSLHAAPELRPMH